jgi:hypothetical protein
MNLPPPQNTGITTQLPETVKNGIQSINNTIQNVQTSVSSSLNQFSEQAQTGVGASSQFLESNTIVAKLAFLILVLFGFLFLMYLGIYLIFYFTTSRNNPYLINGAINGSSPMQIRQDPSISGSVTLNRSNNQATGLEFTWSFWIYVQDITNTAIPNKHIFNKGNNTYGATGIATVNNGIGVYLTSSSAKNTAGGHADGQAADSAGQNVGLHIIIDTVVSDDTANTINIDNIPIQKWVHVAIRIKNTVVDAYVNGVIASRLLLANLAKQNYEDVYVCQNGGFSGQLSNLRYYSSALNVFDINGIVYYGPNTNSAVKLSSSGTNYLSSNWYSYNN